MQVVDLEKDQEVIVTFICAGKRVAFTRDALLEALRPRGEEHRGSLSQASLGRSLAWLLNDIRKGKAADAVGRLSRLLDDFEGVTSPHPSRIPHTLEEIVAAAPTAHGVVNTFLKAHKFRGRGPSFKRGASLKTVKEVVA